MDVYGTLNYQNFIEMTSNMIYVVALGGGFKCPRKIHLNTVTRGTYFDRIVPGIIKVFIFFRVSINGSIPQEKAAFKTTSAS